MRIATIKAFYQAGNLLLLFLTLTLSAGSAGHISASAFTDSFSTHAFSTPSDRVVVARLADEAKQHTSALYLPQQLHTPSRLSDQLPHDLPDLLLADIPAPAFVAAQTRQQFLTLTDRQREAHPWAARAPPAILEI